MLKPQCLLRCNLKKYLRFVVASQRLASQKNEPRTSNDDLINKLKETMVRANVEGFNNIQNIYDEARQHVMIPDWLAVKLASIALSRQKDGGNILLECWKQSGAEKRIDHKSDVTKEQISAALSRVWQAVYQKDNQNSFRKVLDFYNRLRALRFTPVRDTHIAQLIDYGIKCGCSLEHFLELYRDASTGAEKPLTKTVFMLLDRIKSDKEALAVKSVVSQKLPATTLQLLEIFTTLDRGKGLTLADSLNRSNNSLKIDQLKQLVFWASKWKRNNVLEELAEFAQPFGFDTASKVLIYDALVIAYGKNSDIEGLERIAKRIMKEDNKKAFSVTLSRVHHFYKCLNKRPSEEISNSRFANVEKK